VTAQAQVNISAGTTSQNLSNWVYSNSNNVSFGLSGSTITASAVVQSITQFSQFADFATNHVASNASLSLEKVSLPMNISATRLVFLLNISATSNNSGAVTLSHGVYTISSGTASLASSATMAFSWTSGSATSASSQFGGVSGTRYHTVGVNYSMTPGDYLFGLLISSTPVVTVHVFGMAGPTIVGTYDGVETQNFVNGTSVSSTGAFPASIAATNTNYARTGIAANRQPAFILIGTGG
jgi:hypothetical protein